ncbi:hypothetical protein BN7_3315 [Wickerhamomyces ciferrii]|uniref:Cytochrome c oxidase assembly factor 6 n=1 Tax=Wickerhamomyces ciferrii (strain ATCC 14091 / BCRC 22168 / CBS 111 / JCM 3599 / NBRC 0793 / NRRL Y-1031 F-60-10) TaxID=1206466 RepID=K0KLC3_WICCF|nr:uncharacterized protein BN7_3315 [Wickerhamomyces ciferrii]CCH43761.1 hypothetical protein BN7_3315 [Wickerhamomyces ciferrii]
MGLFGGNKEYTPPSRNKREQCWDSRDIFFECLDKNNVINALEDKHADTIKKNCSKEEVNYEQNCAKSWVKYFKEKRVVDFKRAAFLKEMEERGGEQLPFPISKN